MGTQTWTVSSPADLGRAIADIRNSEGLNQGDLAARVGISRAYVAQIERGRSNQLIIQLLRILRRLGATVTITFDGPDE